MLHPDHRYHDALRRAKSGEADCSDNELAGLLRARDRGVAVVQNDLARAFDIYERNGASKTLLEALLMARDTSLEKIATTMQCRIEMVTHYAHYFFDVQVFVDRFDTLDYIASISDDTKRITKKLAMQRGFQFMVSAFTGGHLEMQALDVMKVLQAGAYKLFLQGVDGPITGEAAKEAKAWGGILKGITEQMEKMAPQGAQNNFLAEFRVLFQTEAPIGSIEAVDGEVVRG